MYLFLILVFLGFYAFSGNDVGELLIVFGGIAFVVWLSNMIEAWEAGRKRRSRADLWKEKKGLVYTAIAFPLLFFLMFLTSPNSRKSPKQGPVVEKVQELRMRLSTQPLGGTCSQSSDCKDIVGTSGPEPSFCNNLGKCAHLNYVNQ